MAVASGSRAFGFDIDVHGIMQSSVGHATAAASAIGVTPKLVYGEQNLGIIEFIKGRVFQNSDVLDDALLEKAVTVIKRLHDGSNQVRGPITYFWPFQVVRSYVQVGLDQGSRLAAILPEMAEIADRLEAHIDPFTPVLTHNDLVPQNIMLDGADRVWLIDWDYGGYGHPLFDLAGLCANFDAPEPVEQKVLALYYGAVDDRLLHQFKTFRLIINLREYMWGMVQEVVSDLNSEAVQAAMAELYPDQEQGYEGYTNLNRERFEAMWTTSRDAYR